MGKVIITGAAGFIGSHLCDKFLEMGYHVVGIDNFITGSSSNIEHLGEAKKFEFIKHDVSTPLEIDHKIDLILHFACPASPQDYLNFPVETLKVNSMGTLNMLELAREYDSRYVFASTSEIYGSPTISPQSESYWGNVNPIGIRSVYDESKRFSEASAMAFHREYQLDSRIIRIFNTYGPRMRVNDGRVIPNFITQALKKEEITVYGNGNQTRSFCYVDDLIDGIFKISTLNGLNGEIMNLGNPAEYQIIELAKMIKTQLASPSEIIFQQLPEDDPQQRCPDLEKTMNLVQWKPETSLEEGIERTVEFFKRNYDL